MIFMENNTKKVIKLGRYAKKRPSFFGKEKIIKKLSLWIVIEPTLNIIEQFP